MQFRKIITVHAFIYSIINQNKGTKYNDGVQLP